MNKIYKLKLDNLSIFDFSQFFYQIYTIRKMFIPRFKREDF